MEHMMDVGKDGFLSRRNENQLRKMDANQERTETKIEVNSEMFEVQNCLSIDN
jgi:hypothetical protein